MSFDALTAGAVALTVDRAPVVLDRYATGGPARYVDFGLDCQPVVTEYTRGTGAPAASELRLQFTLLSAAQVATLDSILNAGGPITVLTKAGASAVTCAAAPREQQKIEPMVAPYRDDLARAGLMVWKADITLIRL